ncbi:unnamed protein product [Mytilus coruscus]|uniref:Uncharacterized protein n=1 Tax=Mytilus coruscus TaxID=42192 RepID=A0A6J8DSN7_MYTCO|nr:unnamed protein product [Mytilus coruscus]
MGRHNREKLRAYRQQRKFQKRQKKKLLKLQALSATEITTCNDSSKIELENDTKNKISLETIEKNVSLTYRPQYLASKDINPSSVTNDSEKRSTSSGSSSKSPFSLSESDLIETRTKVESKKPKLVRNGDRLMNDPLYFKWKEYQLLSARIQKLKGSI